MLGVLCARPPKPWIISPQTFSLHHTHLHHQPWSTIKDRYNNKIVSSAASIDGGTCAAASIWRVIVPSAAGGADWRSDYLRPAVVHHHHKGEGSWNVASDARPARWLHRLDLSYLLFGVCLCLAPIDWNDVVLSQDHNAALSQSHSSQNLDSTCSSTYRVTGVLADGRCLFRAIAHGVCLQTGEEAPDENRQRELADDLRARVVEELLERRKDIEWFIEGDFDAYVKRIQQPYIWGGEPELLMASHVLKKLISVFMKDRSTGKLTNIANYGEEYKEEYPINVLFHGYGHYELLETSLN
ncbi:hypothetical protein BVRB_4g093890 [Beta vulgaris subsp. vulgaris]|uniref:OVARIAN TUMOR DOMAIN-containing deubiquitinating enzyme 4 n=1 Tax=Beta vulgaris subsp. vulgaris TaxID=3555 RepID=UPI00053FBA72|nr:OVARIAN TUMOR DOMAIN-containing deubiquitinating enzyme 4 [Beta vulgaris subsp. vulgaris]KMS98322.1 hypothetical protein BVRB_4g093890 [Beta vulgaris subsp. vulgaris]